MKRRPHKLLALRKTLCSIVCKNLKRMVASTDSTSVDRTRFICLAPLLTTLQGRLGSLGTIPEKYDIAITTACGSLNHLVVDTVDQAQFCIEYIRKQGIGRASFSVLDKLSSDARTFQPIETPENVPRLFDLVKPKEAKFAPAFWKALQNTLVADSLEQANRIAYGARRWRVVTLAGQLIDSSGTMSGGGSKPSKGGMSSKLTVDAVSPAVLEQYEKDSRELEMELATSLKEKAAFEAESEARRKRVPQVEMAISKSELDIQTADRRIKEAESRVKELKSVVLLLFFWKLLRLI